MGHYLIVGSSSGIGAQLTADLLSAGHQITSICRRTPELTGKITHHNCDVMKDALPAFDTPIDGLAYLPGSINLKPFARLSEDDFRNDWEINCLGAIRCIQHCLPMLQKVEQSSIVLVSTVAVQRGMAFHASIAAAKGAVEGLGRSLASELAPKVRVNVVAPSLTETPLASALTAKGDTIAKRHPLQRLGQAKDVSQAIAYLLSEDASWITGQLLGVDGGLSTLSSF